MKAIIEKPFNTELHIDKMAELNLILYAIRNSYSAIELADNVRKAKVKADYKLKKFHYFHVGFGSSHMWVHERDPEFNSMADDRLLLVEF